MESIRISANAAIIKDNKILVIEFEDDQGLHYNLPGGGVELGESLEMALKRECLEEAMISVEVSGLLLVWQYIPALENYKFGPRQRLGHIYECHLQEGSVPQMPPQGDRHQIGVKWIDVAQLSSSYTQEKAPLFPQVGDQLLMALKERHLI